MRRKDKEITDRDAIDKILYKSQVLHLGVCYENQPYVVPASFGYDGESIYYHSAPEGMKIDYVEKNPNVCFSTECDVKLIRPESVACGFTFAYHSVIGFGKVSEITNKDEKIAGVNIILSHYSKEKWTLPEEIFAHVRLWKIKIESLTGKHSPPSA